MASTLLFNLAPFCFVSNSRFSEDISGFFWISRAIALGRGKKYKIAETGEKVQDCRNWGKSTRLPKPGQQVNEDLGVAFTPVTEAGTG
jgi:hypothetical protein